MGVVAPGEKKIWIEAVNLITSLNLVTLPGDCLHFRITVRVD